MRNEEGFTMMELMVFIFILIFILGGVYGLIESGFRSNAISYSVVQITDASREALSTMIRQIRVATSVDPAYTNNNTIVFTGDVDGNGTYETVGFTASGGNLLRYDGSAWEEWVKGIDSVTFTYYAEGSSNPLAVGSPNWNLKIKRVDITLNLSANALGNTVTRTFRGTVSLRNNLQ